MSKGLKEACLVSMKFKSQLWEIISKYPLLNVVSIRIYILMTGVVSNETNTYVRMYIEEFILVDIWIHCCTKLNWRTLENILAFIHSQQRTEKCENCS